MAVPQEDARFAYVLNDSSFKSVLSSFSDAFDNIPNLDDVSLAVKGISLSVNWNLHVNLGESDPSDIVLVADNFDHVRLDLDDIPCGLAVVVLDQLPDHVLLFNIFRAFLVPVSHRQCLLKLIVMVSFEFQNVSVDPELSLGFVKFDDGVESVFLFFGFLLRLEILGFVLDIDHDARLIIVLSLDNPYHVANLKIFDH